MMQVGQPYRPSGAFGVRDTVSMMILGTVVAALGAALVWLWEISPIPTLVLITPLLQGACIGGVLMFMIRRMRIRNPALSGVLGFACGLLSITLVHYGHYLHLSSALQTSIAEGIRNDPQLTNEERAQELAALEKDPNAVVDRVLKFQTGGHGGFVGSMMLRNEQGVTIKHTTVSGGFLWALWGGEALMVAGFAGSMASGQASSPYCEDCQAWCAESKGVSHFAAGHADQLITAIQADDLAGVNALRTTEPEVDLPGATAIDLHSCAGCDLTLATVVLRVPKGKKNEIKELVKLKQVRLSPSVAEAVRQVPSEPSPVATLTPDDIEPEDLNEGPVSGQ